MSSYISAYGYIEYKDKDSLNKALKLLVKGSWLNKDHEWLDDGDSVIDTSTQTVNNLTLAMPNTCMRNLGHLLGDCLKGVSSCKVVWTCTDGDFSGGIITAKPSQLKKDLNIESKVTEKTYDLMAWAKKNKMPIVKYSEKNAEKYYEWITDIEDAFIDKYL